MTRCWVLLAGLMLGCGERSPGQPDGAAGQSGAGRDAAPGDAADSGRPDAGACPGDRATVACPNDPQPCPGACNARGHCELDCGQGPEIRIPASTVVMGVDDPVENRIYSPPESLSRVERTFFIDKYEVSIARYRACVEAGGCRTPRGGLRCFYHDPPTVDQELLEPWGIAPEVQHPMNCVSWHEAEAYCRWKGARLPTELEWTLAARGPASTSPGSCELAEDLKVDGRCNGRRYPWGDDRDVRRANVNADDGLPLTDGGLTPSWRGKSFTPIGYFDGTTHPGGRWIPSYETRDGASVFGVHDMTGNVVEWCADLYQPNPPDSRGPYRLLKSSWYRAPPEVAVVWKSLAGIGAENPEDATDATGIRCARDIP
jgi:formylglycine-generating enzyme required for sulfatase activity